jgi:uncharacterized protein (TIGR02147 family)
MNDFRLYLQEELVSRCRKNPRYSLRSFAKSLGVNHGILSMVLNKKRTLTPNMVRTMGTALKLNSDDLDRFVIHVPQINPRKKNAQAKLINQMTVDMFNVISDWYHDAILELSRVQGFRGTPEYISRRLGISVVEAQAAIERLERVGLIEIMPNGSWKEILGDNTTAIHVDTTSVALRDLQRQVLTKSLHALENIPKPQRDHTCMTVAVRIQDLPEAKRRIKQFRLELMEFLQKHGNELEEVYQLAVSFYPLTKLKNG